MNPERHCGGDIRDLVDPTLWTNCGRRWRSCEAMTKRRAFDTFAGLRPFLFRTSCLEVERGKERRRARAVVSRARGAEHRREPLGGPLNEDET